MGVSESEARVVVGRRCPGSGVLWHPQTEPLIPSEPGMEPRAAREMSAEESNVQSVDWPVTVCGDIHGQLCNLKELAVPGRQRRP